MNTRRFVSFRFIFSTTLLASFSIHCAAQETGEPSAAEFLFASSLFWMAVSEEERIRADEMMDILHRIREGDFTEPSPTLLELVDIPSGSFLMGNSGEGRDEEFGRSNEYPRHQVDVAYSFQIGKYEVTNAEFAEMLNWAHNRGYVRTVTGAPYEGGNAYVSGRVLIGIDDSSHHLEQGYIGFNGGFFVESREGVLQSDHPVLRVTWVGAATFCNWLSEREGRTPAYDIESNWELTNPNDGGYRLPSESEWEYACRGSEANPNRYAPFSFGDSPGFDLDCCLTSTFFDQFMRWCGNQYDGTICAPQGGGPGDFNYTSPVGSLTPNDFGLHDMHGNVWEWCEDVWHDDYEGGPSDGSSWTQDSQGGRVLRGGSWLMTPMWCRSALRTDAPRTTRDSTVGFRVVKVEASGSTN